MIPFADRFCPSMAWLAALALSFPSAALVAQVSGDLATYRTHRLVTALGDVRIADALRIGLNSSGDDLRGPARALPRVLSCSLSRNGVPTTVALRIGEETVNVALLHCATSQLRLDSGLLR